MEAVYKIHELTPPHYDSAAKLWSLVFGDNEALVREFYRLFGKQSGFACCATANGEVVAAAYCPAGTDYIAADGTAEKGAYLYAVATHPDHRKQQLAMHCCRWLQENTFRNTGSLLFTKPSEESLYPWYEEKINAVPALGGRRIELTGTASAPLSMQPLSHEAYFRLRNELLCCRAHVRHSIEWLEWESLLHKAYGGGFYTIGDSIADLYFDGTSLQINELLPHPTAAQADSLIQGIMAAMGAEACVCTVFGDEKYVSVAHEDGNLPQNAWFGPCYG